MDSSVISEKCAWLLRDEPVAGNGLYDTVTQLSVSPGLLIAAARRDRRPPRPESRPGPIRRFLAAQLADRQPSARPRGGRRTRATLLLRATAGPTRCWTRTPGT